MRRNSTRSSTSWRGRLTASGLRPRNRRLEEVGLDRARTAVRRLHHSFDRRGGSSPVKRENASHDALGPGGHSCCHTPRGTSASGSNLLANRPYSCFSHSPSRWTCSKNPISPAICAFWTSAELLPPTPIPFIRLCRPSAKGRNPHADSSAVFTARQSVHASHDHRVGPPAVPLQQMMHRSIARETSHPFHFSGESSSPHDCQRPCR